MLVLTRRKGESIDIGNDIRVVILGRADGRSRNGWRIGIEAPPDVLISRSEVPARVLARLKIKRGKE